MWEWLSKGKNLQGIGAIAGAGANIYGGIEQASAANKMIDLQKQQFKINKSLIQEDESQKRETRKAYGSVFGGPSFKLKDSKVKDYTDA